jgi:hypothetical protein
MLSPVFSSLLINSARLLLHYVYLMCSNHHFVQTDLTSWCLVSERAASRLMRYVNFWEIKIESWAVNGTVQRSKPVNISCANSSPWVPYSCPIFNYEVMHPLHRETKSPERHAVSVLCSQMGFTKFAYTKSLTIRAFYRFYRINAIQ